MTTSEAGRGDAGAIARRIEELGLTLPPAVIPPSGVVLPFEGAIVVGDRLVFSGHGPQARDGTVVGPFGHVGAEVTLDEAYAAAALTAMSVIATVQRMIGDLDRVVGWTRIFGMVNAAPGFTATPSVINGFSDRVIEIFGPVTGAHTRSAVGMAELPFGIPVEVEGELAISS